MKAVSRTRAEGEDACPFGSAQGRLQPPGRRRYLRSSGDPDSQFLDRETASFQRLRNSRA
jgi:hypothetical protein